MSIDPAKRLRGDFAQQATDIQKWFRKSQETLKGICAKALGPESEAIPQADAGKTKVFLPLEMPHLVLKYSRDQVASRLDLTTHMRARLNRLQCPDLVVPRAFARGDFLVEERLPITTDSYANMAIYLSNIRLFDAPVRQMTRLFSEVYLSDLLVSSSSNPLGHIEGVNNYVRYDNLPLYVVDNKAKFGLIDLEHIQYRKDHPEALPTLARIFPLHLDIIKDEAQKLGMKIDHEVLNKASEKGKKYLQFGYTDHLEWIKKKSEIIEISEERMKAISKVVEQELLKLDRGENEIANRIGYKLNVGKDFLVNPEEAAKELAPVVAQKIIESLKREISATEKVSDLVSFRSPRLERPKLYKDALEVMRKNEKVLYNNMGGIYFERGYAGDQLAFVVLQELQKGGEIFYHDPAHYTGGRELCWVRY